MTVSRKMVPCAVFYMESPPLILSSYWIQTVDNVFRLLFKITFMYLQKMNTYLYVNHTYRTDWIVIFWYCTRMCTSKVSYFSMNILYSRHPNCPNTPNGMQLLRKRKGVYMTKILIFISENSDVGWRWKLPSGQVWGKKFGPWNRLSWYQIFLWFQDMQSYLCDKMLPKRAAAK